MKAIKDTGVPGVCVRERGERLSARYITVELLSASRRVGLDVEVELESSQAFRKVKIKIRTAVRPMGSRVTFRSADHSGSFRFVRPHLAPG